jgi:NAD(P)-dependent dehydrogenase (short-subunit alcohol dehydrogenase family)
MHVLVVGATGRIGPHVVEQVLAAGYRTTAVVRDAGRAQTPTPGRGPSSNGRRGEVDRIDFGIVRDVFGAVGEHRVRVALMTAIGVTLHEGSYNRSTNVNDWKRGIRHAVGRKAELGEVDRRDTRERSGRDVGHEETSCPGTDSPQQRRREVSLASGGGGDGQQPA